MNHVEICHYRYRPSDLDGLRRPHSIRRLRGPLAFLKNEVLPRTLLAVALSLVPVPALAGGFYANLDAECRRALYLGGPCGCWASEYLFGRSIRELWLADNWGARYPRSSCHPGAIAWWPHRHVAPVTDCGSGTMIVADSWGTHEASMRGVIFLDPR